MSRRAAALAATVAALTTTATLVSFQSHAIAQQVAPTTPAAPPTTLGTAPSTSAATTVTPTTVAPTTAAPTTFPGPTPRASQRVASPVDIAKIRATSLPLRMMGIMLAAVLAALAAVGFVYGKVRSRIPAVAIPRPAQGGSPPPGTPMPPPLPIPLPPPVVEDAVADTVIFEPPPSHYAPPVFAPPAPEPAEPEPVEPETTALPRDP